MVAMRTQVHLIEGPNEFLAQRARESVVAQVREELGEVTVTDMAAGEVTDSELLEVLSPSLFGDGRVVVLHHAETAAKSAAELIVQAAVDPGPGIYLVVEHSGGGRNKAVATKLEKIAQVWPAQDVKRNQLLSWVNEEFQRHGTRVSPDVVHALLEGVGSDLRELATAISQLVADAEGEVTARLVKTYYSGVAEVSSFDIADWAVAGQGSRAVAAVRRALQLGASPVALAAALSNKVGMIARLYGTRGRVDESALAREIGAHPFVIKKTIPVARRWSADAVSRAVIAMADLDAEVKGQGGDPAYAVEAAVQKIARLSG